MVGQDKPYVPIHREPSLGVGPSLQDHKLGWPEGRAPVMVCLTVDTETSIGGGVWRSALATGWGGKKGFR